MQPDVRYWSKADIAGLPAHVRFTLNSEHSLVALRCPLCATSRHRVASLHHLVGGEQQLGRYLKSKRLRRFEIAEEFELARRQNWQYSGLWRASRPSMFWASCRGCRRGNVALMDKLESARRNLATIQMERNQALEIFRTEGFHYAA